MGSAANLPDEPADAAALARHADALATEVEVALPGWAARCVTVRWQQWHGRPPGAEVVAAAGQAGEQVRDAAMAPLRALLGSDVDEQRTNPLSILRASVGPVTAALRALGVPPVARDEQAERLFPEDDYDVGPAAFADLGPAVHEAGITWGAAKAHVVLRRRRGGR